MLAAVLRAAAFEVLEARNGRDLLVRFRQAMQGKTRPAIIVTDIDMPGMDGVSALRAIHHSTVRTPAIVISALAGYEPLRRAAITAGATRVLEKPFDIISFRRAVEEVASADPKLPDSLRIRSDR